MTSSPMVLTTEPPCCSVARRMISMQTATLSRAATSPRSSNSRVLPTTSANRIASSCSCPIRPAPRRGLHNLDYRRETGGAPKPGRGHARRLLRREADHGPERRNLDCSDPAPRRRAIARTPGALSGCRLAIEGSAQNRGMLRAAPAAERRLVRHRPLPAPRRSRDAGEDHACDRRDRGRPHRGMATASRRK